MGRLLAWLKRCLCTHLWLVGREPDRLRLHCPYCGAETHGWEIGR